MADFTDEQIAHLKQLLDQRERELRADLHREANEKGDYADLAAEAPDAGDSSFANLVVDLGNAEITRDLTELRAIEAARRRMENGVYGECTNCQTDIPYARLEVQPTAERCAPCQGFHERTHGGDAMRGATL